LTKRVSTRFVTKISLLVGSRACAAHSSKADQGRKRTAELQKRYWLQIVLDRDAETVLGQQLEEVAE